MDEPCSALDPIATLKIEELIERAQAATTRSSSSRTTCSRPRASPTRRRSCSPASSSSIAPTEQDLHQPRTTAARRTTSPASSAEPEAGPWTGTAAGCQHDSQRRASSRARGPRAGRRSTSSSSSSTASMEALEHQDVELAEMVIADDDRLDGRYLEVHQGILSLLALQAPVAGDLRLVAALLHTIKHIERMGDQCVNIAKLIPLTGHEPPVDDELLDDDPAHGPPARARRSCSASGRSPSATSRSPRTSCARTARSTALNREVFRRAIEIGDDPDTREWAMTHDDGRARARADRRQRRRHRRAGGVRRHRAVPRVLGLVAPSPARSERARSSGL